VDALRRLHEVLVSDGKVVDTQPLSPRPSVFASGERLGSLDMREWAQTIASVDAQIDRALTDGLFVVEAERRFVVTDSFDTGDEFVDEVREWAGTKVARRLAEGLRTTRSPITLEQEVRFRLFGKPD
jgi:hypothetical protein